MVADPYLPVPPRLYGGIERIIAFLVEALAARGHQVTLWAAPGSMVPAQIILYGCPPHRGPLARLCELGQVTRGLLQRSTRFDVIHSFGRLAAVLPLTRLGVPVLQSYQREITLRSARLGARLGGECLAFTACSSSCRHAAGRFGRWTTVYNGVRLGDYQLQVEVGPDAPLVFLGRLEPIKGAHNAIALAKATGRRLILAGNVPPEHSEYFRTQVEPHLGDRIEYVGPVDDAMKNRLLGQAAALLMLIEWEEPFGIVMAEALACGTPVIGFRRGAVPEVVEHGATGFVCDTLAEAIDAVPRLPQLDRRACRESCERRFSSGVIVDAYEALHRDLLSRRPT